MRNTVEFWGEKKLDNVGNSGGDKIGSPQRKTVGENEELPELTSHYAQTEAKILLLICY